MGGINEFLLALKQDDKAKELLKDQPKPASDEEAAGVYASIAEKMGFQVTKEDIVEGLKGLEKIQRTKTDADVKQALDEDMLEQVAGGGADPRCSDTFSRGEWCWFTDSCAYIITSYGDDPAVGEADPGANILSQEVIDEQYNNCSVKAYAAFDLDLHKTNLD